MSARQRNFKIIYVHAVYSCSMVKKCLYSYFFLINQISASKFTPHVQLLKVRSRADMASKDVL